MISLINKFVESKIGRLVVFISLLTSFVIGAFACAINVAAVMAGRAEPIMLLVGFASLVGSASSQYLMVTLFGRKDKPA